MIDLLQNSRWVRVLCNLEEQFVTIPDFSPILCLLLSICWLEITSAGAESPVLSISMGPSTFPYDRVDTPLLSTDLLNSSDSGHFCCQMETWESGEEGNSPLFSVTWAQAAAGSRLGMYSPGGAHRIPNPHTTNHKTASQCLPALSALDSSNQRKQTLVFHRKGVWLCRMKRWEDCDCLPCLKDWNIWNLVHDHAYRCSLHMLQAYIESYFVYLSVSMLAVVLKNIINPKSQE